MTTSSTPPDGTVVNTLLTSIQMSGVRTTLLWEVRQALQERAEQAGRERRVNLTPGLWEAVAIVNELLASADLEHQLLLDAGVDHLGVLVDRLQDLTAPADKR